MKMLLKDHLFSLACFLVLTACLLPKPLSATEAFEVGRDRRDSLPGGKEADGIVGDFIMRNNLIEAVISSDAPLRKADMGGWWDAVSPGCLYDLTLLGADNDQLTVFSPSNQRGPVSHVRLVEDGAQGEAVIETLVSAASHDGVEIRHVYRLKDDWHGLVVETHLDNQSTSDYEWDPADQWKPTQDRTTAANIITWDAIDPADKCGYAVSWLDLEGFETPDSGLMALKPGERVSYARAIAVATSPLEAFGFLASLKTPCGRLVGQVKDPEGKGIGTAVIEFQRDEVSLRHYPDDEGQWNLQLPSGSYQMRIMDQGRSELVQTVNIEADQVMDVSPTMGQASQIHFDVRDEADRSLPCKAQFLGLEPTPSPNLGPENRAHGCKDQYHSESGLFSVALSPGSYRVVVTHGIEFSHVSQVITLKEGGSEHLSVTLKRLVDTTGWVSTDFHNHSTPSGDNHTKTDDRIINLAAEQVEFAPTTEHNRLYDWTPHIEALGLSAFLHSVPGVELTGSGTHFNAFPFTPEPDTQDYGAPQWQKDPRLNPIVLRDFQGVLPERWVHLNHPDTVAVFVDRDGDGLRDNGYPGLGDLVDAAEVWGLNILADAPYYIGESANKVPIVRNHREFIWRQWLNTGKQLWCLSVSDAHSVHGNGVGGWRTYVPSSTDEPDKLDWKEIVRHAKAGQMMMTTGPFLEVQTEDGQISGGATRAQGSIGLKVKVQCTDWVQIDRIQVLVNSRKVPTLNYTRKTHPEWFGDGVVQFDQHLQVPLSEDSHLIVVAYGEESDLSIGYGSSTQASWKPCAYHNPIYVDVDGNGFQANGDTLGWELPVKRLDVEEVQAMIDQRTR